jgi:hypothetical protein
MPVTKYGTTGKWKTVGTRIPPEDLKRLEDKYPDRGKRSEVIRALIQMHLNGKIFVSLEFTQKV